jgi:thioredoxin-related protein
MSSFSITRRRFAMATSSSLIAFNACAAPATLPTTTSLPLELIKALKAGQPLLVMVSLEGCPFCKVVRENYLGPMREREGLAVVQVDMRSKLILTDFNKKELTQDELIRSWGVKVAPTVLFFGRGGVEVVERLTGGYIPDFYGAYLDERLKVARALLSNQR